jgi:hypothetical protein
MPEFTFEIKGVTLNMDEMYKVHFWFNIYNTAEYLLENYPQLSEDEAVRLASAVRDLMDTDGYDEDQAVEQVLRNKNII